LGFAAGFEEPLLESRLRATKHLLDDVCSMNRLHAKEPFASLGAFTERSATDVVSADAHLKECSNEYCRIGERVVFQ
jgi:hypothetical protein